MMTDLRFKVETSYGRTRAYPVDQTAILLIRLAKSKTLLPGDLGTFAGLGYRCVDQDGNEITISQLY
jgi:cell shape-determining protein MreC